MRTDSNPTRLYQQIYHIVRQIPVGQVATYGQVARLLGKAGWARQVGYALFRVVPDADVPWHRVINAKGEISQSPQRQGSDELQRILLEQEGITFNHQGRISLKVYGWHPEPGQYQD